MTVCLLRIGDGRDEYHQRSWDSAKLMLPAFDQIATIDDRDHQLGFAGAIAAGWRQALASGCDHVFHLELDFTFHEEIPVAAMIALLTEQPHLVQVALKRQPVNPEEVAAGGVIELRPDDYRQRVHGGVIWTENRHCFTTNPCVYPAKLCRHGWPQATHSEGVFTQRLLEDPAARFAYWGAKFDPPLVEHIGEGRTGRGY